MYKYFAYGLKIQSDSCFEQFVPMDFAGKADLTIHHFVEDEIKQILKEDNQISVIGKDIFFRNYAGYFEARQGNELFFEEREGINEREAKEFVMGNAFALLFLEREANVIHGAAVRYKDKSIIISGDSGAGKSTITTEFIKRGAKLITDDQAVIILENRMPMIIPGYPSQKLCEDAAQRNELDISELVKVDDTKNKYAVSRSDKYYSEISKVDAAFFISRHDEGQDLITNTIRGAEKLNVLTANLFLKPFFINTVSVPPKMMMDCLAIADKLDMYTISRKKSAATQNQILDFIEMQID